MLVSLLTEKVQAPTNSELTLGQGNMQGPVLRWHYVCVDLINKNMQHNHPGTWARVQVLPRPSAPLYLHHWLLPQRDGAGFGTALCPPLNLQATSDKQSYFAQLAVSSPQPQKYGRIFSLSRCVGGLIRGSASVTSQPQTSELLSVSFLHKRMHSRLECHTNIREADTLFAPL